MAGQVGFCGLDRRRTPLRGDEIRGCWEVGAEHLEEPEAPPDEDLVRPVHRLRDFVPIDELRRPDADPRAIPPMRATRSRSAVTVPAADPAPASVASVALEADAWRDRVTLFGDEA